MDLTEEQESAAFEIIAKSAELRAAIVAATREFGASLIPGFHKGQAKAQCAQLDQLRNQILSVIGRRKGRAENSPSGVVTPDEGNTGVTRRTSMQTAVDQSATGRTLPTGHIWP